MITESRVMAIINEELNYQRGIGGLMDCIEYLEDNYDHIERMALVCQKGKKTQVATEDIEEIYDRMLDGCKLFFVFSDGQMGQIREYNNLFSYVIYKKGVQKAFEKKYGPV